MSPATATTPPTLATAPAVKPAEPVVLVVASTAAVGHQASVDGAIADEAMGDEATRGVTMRTQPSSVAMPRLHDGKSIPGPDEWRALERRARSFRLRGRDGAIGRGPGA